MCTRAPTLLLSILPIAISLLACDGEARPARDGTPSDDLALIPDTATSELDATHPPDSNETANDADADDAPFPPETRPDTTPDGGPEVDVPAQPEDLSHLIYDPYHGVGLIELTLSEAALDSLRASPDTWVDGVFRFRFIGDATWLRPPQPVSVRLKGGLGSFRPLDDKPAFRLDFERAHPGADFGGLEEMTLNSMVQDRSRLHEILAYDLFARMGVPAPRTAHVWLRINDDDYGLYLDVETPDRVFRRRHFDSTLAMFEGEYGSDVLPGHATTFDFDGGELAPGLAALEALARRVADAPVEGFMAALDDVIDWDNAIAHFATEVFIGHHDSYALNRNNYFIHFDDQRVARWLPWGTDQTFVAAVPLHSRAHGVVFSRCLADVACRAAYDAALARLARIVSAPDYIRWLDDHAATLQGYVDNDPRAVPADVENLLYQAWAYLLERVAHVDDVLGCSAAPDADADGDGFACHGDCDESDPTINVGATERCDDDIDQDCSGRADDGPSCGLCTHHVIDARAYLTCAQTFSWSDATTLCANRGGALARVDSADAHAQVVALLTREGLQSVWLGASDREVEGTFRWHDGSPLADGFTLWRPGEPNDGGLVGEDCLELVIDDPIGWADTRCNQRRASLCELPPAQRQ